MLAGFGGLDSPGHVKLIRQWVINRIDVRIGEKESSIVVGGGGSKLRSRSEKSLREMRWSERSG